MCMCKVEVTMDNDNMRVEDTNTAPDNSLQDRVRDMYNILLQISQELEKIKTILKQKTLTREDSNSSFDNLIINDVMTNQISVNLLEENKSTTEHDEPLLDVLEGSQGHQGHLVDSQDFKSVSEVVGAVPMARTLLSAKPGKDEAIQLAAKGALRPPSPFLVLGNRWQPQGQVILNVGGKRHEVRWNTLDKYPTSRLARLRHCVTRSGLEQICDSYNVGSGEYYFDRSPRNFDAILCLYRTGKLHLTQGVCVQDFCEELDYWGLDDLYMEPCCQHSYYRARWLLPQNNDSEESLEDFGTGMFAHSQRHLWNLFENPHHSFAAKVVAVVSCLFVVVSTLCLIISTLPSFQQKNNDGIAQEEYFFEVAEAVFVGWFTFEYVIRFIAAPHKLRFVKGVMNIIDLAGIFPYFMSLSLSLITTSGGLSNDQTKYQDEMRRIAQIFRIMRILRIFKLARHITGLQTLGMTLRNSYKELGLLMLVVIMGMLIFSGLAYVSEKDEEGTMFISMPQALYWAIITMTSVGYGDIYPTTWFGKLVGSACAICGVLCISLPIPIIVNNFNKFYEKAKIEEEIIAKKKKASWEEAKRGEQQPAQGIAGILERTLLNFKTGNRHHNSQPSAPHTTTSLISIINNHSPPAPVENHINQASNHNNNINSGVESRPEQPVSNGKVWPTRPCPRTALSQFHSAPLVNNIANSNRENTVIENGMRQCDGVDQSSVLVNNFTLKQKGVTSGLACMEDDLGFSSKLSHLQEQRIFRGNSLTANNLYNSF